MSHPKKRFKYRIFIQLDRPTEVSITWPHEYETFMDASRMLGEVASQLLKVGVRDFKLKVVL